MMKLPVVRILFSLSVAGVMLSAAGQVASAPMPVTPSVVVPSVVARGPGGYGETIFQRIDQKTGSVTPVVQALAQDARGFLWVGTEGGIFRWDGYRSRAYSMQLGIEGALPENNVFSLYADPQKRLWIGTKSRGLVLYDAAHDRFESYLPAGKEKSYKAIYALTTDGAGGLFVATRGGLDHFDPATKMFEHVPMGGQFKTPTITSLLHDADGRTLAGTTKGLFRSDAQGKNFTLVPIVKDQITHVWSLLRDSGGRLWIGTTSMGVYVMEGPEDAVRPVPETGPDGNALAVSPLQAQGVDAMSEAAPGTVWLGTYQDGIVSVDAATLQTHRIVHENGFATSLPNDNVVAMHRDTAGSVWVGTIHGLSRADEGSAGIETFFGAGTGGAENAPGTATGNVRINDTDISAVLPTKDGRVWVGLNANGVQVFEKSGALLASILPSTAKKKSVLPAGQISGMAEAPNGDVYFGGATWVMRADKDGKHVALLTTAVKPPSATPQEKNDAVHSVVYDGGTLWVGSGSGLWKQDVSGDTAGKPTPPPVGVPITKIQVTALARGEGNDLWVGTATELMRYDVASGAVLRFPVDTSREDTLPAAVTSALVDYAGRVWVTTFGGGVCELDAGTSRMRRLMKGLPNANTDDVLEAKDGNIWVTTDDGLALIDPKTFEITPLGQPSGVAISNYWVAAGGAASDGRLMFGGVGGLTIVQPELVKPWTYVPSVDVTEVRIGGKEVPFSDVDGEPLKVRHEANSLEVDFSALDYTAPQQNQYAYRLVGFDRDWVATDATRRTASYTNLPPGEYTLEMRGSNRNGVWGATREVAVRVVPAWWQTIWAKMLAFVALVLAMYAAILIATAYQRKRQRVLEQRVAERTEELQQMTEELAESHRQMETIAYTDSLTGLANRRMFADFFRRLLSRKRRENGGFVLMVLDLDKFKEINDTYGHDAGDAWLKEVANKVAPIVRESDCFARLGGDEFGILLSDGMNQAGITKFCEAIAASVAATVTVEGVAVKTTLSIGVSVYPGDGTEQDALLKSADVALYEVKREGGDGWRVAEGMNAKG